MERATKPPAKVPAKRAPATKAPASKAPATKAPASKAPAKPPAKVPAKGPAKPPSRPPSPARPPQKTPSGRRPAPTPGAAKKPKGAPKVQKCATIVDCTSCINNKCHFDKVTFTCATPGNTLNKVTNRLGCPQMLQMQKVRVSVALLLSHVPHTTDQVFPKKAGRPRAGVAPAALNTKFEQVRAHVFRGEQGNPNAGRHTLSAFIQTHANARPVKQNARNKIQEFSVRLVILSYLTLLLIFITVGSQERQDCLARWSRRLQ